MVADFVSEKFDPFVDGIATLKERISTKQAEDSLRLKRAIKLVPGGRISFVGNTAINRRGKTVKYCFMDEVALYEHSDVEEFKSRTKSFEGLGRKIFIVSSSMYKGDPIQTAYYDAYCKKELHVVCDKCEKSFYPTVNHFKYMTKKEYLESNEEFNLLQYKREAIKTARVQCECGNDIYYKDLERYVRNDRVKLITIAGDAEVDTKIGYKLNALATGLTHYEKMAEKLIEADDDVNKLSGIYREYFNEIYEIKFEDKEESDMFLLNSYIPEYKVPKDTAEIYLTIDNQLDHLYAQITAIEYGMKVHIVYFGRIESWDQAEKLWEICQYLEGEDGTIFTATKMGIDRRGYNEGQISRTNEADWFVHYMTDKWGQDRIYGMEGHSEIAGGKSYTIRKRKDDSNQRQKLDVKIVQFSNLYIKNKLFTWMDRTIAHRKAEEGTEEYHYDDKMVFINQDNIERDMEHIENHSLTKMLTAEVWGKIKDKKTGRLTEKEGWIPIRKRNDAIDTTSMAIALSEMDLVAMRQKPDRDIDIVKSLDRLGNF
jgi:phage terminase large subunit GpA-like protein